MPFFSSYRDEERYRFMIETIPQIVWAARADGWIDYDNPRWYEYTGLDPERGVGWGWESVIHPDDLPEVDRKWNEALQTGVGYTIEYRLRRHDGVYRWILDRAIPMRDAQGHALRWFGTCTDIEDQKRIEGALRESQTRLGVLNDTLEKEVAARTEELRKKEMELFQTQKLEAVGRLAGGVAHDFNNLLTGILGIADSLREGLAPEDPRLEELEEMKNGVERAFSLTRQLLAFGRRQISQRQWLDLNTIVREMNPLLRRLIGEHIEIDLSLRAIDAVHADRGQIEQILMNLVINARDAMPQGGRIQIRTVKLSTPHMDPSLQLNVPPGSYTLLEVRDTGIGMDAETLSNIFEPFFTTKPEGHGSGLGLATVYGIVKQSNGDIRVDSAPGQGAVFKIAFPSSPQSTTELHGEAGQVPQGREETVLVVEDEPLVRVMVARRLEKGGYRVITASNSAEALHSVETHQEPIHLVLSDVVMPVVNGRELTQQLLARRPDMAVLYMSGYPREIIAPQGMLDPDVQFIDKSALSVELLSKVRETLDQNLS